MINQLASSTNKTEMRAAIQGNGDVPSPIHRAAQHGHADAIIALVSVVGVAVEDTRALVNQVK